MKEPEGLPESVIKALERIATGYCPHCCVDIEKEETVGRCVYIKPCGHRLGQGKARNAKQLAEAKAHRQER